MSRSSPAIVVERSAEARPASDGVERISPANETGHVREAILPAAARDNYHAYLSGHAGVVCSTGVVESEQSWWEPAVASPNGAGARSSYTAPRGPARRTTVLGSVAAVAVGLSCSPLPNTCEELGTSAAPDAAAARSASRHARKHPWRGPSCASPPCTARTRRGREACARPR